ncbi:MAG: hypothetical protein HYX27_23995 [Acidobacteria bacterium]|nr:hypothetical protein [Acidobacteriota bacterium]
MQFSRILRRYLLSFGVLSAFGVSAQTPAASEVQGLPARAAATDYQAQAKAGDVTIGAEFVGHSVPTMQGPLSSEDYVSVEIGFFGAAGAKLKISFEEFSLRINGKKTALPSQQFGLVMKSLSDPEWIPPVVDTGKSKGGLSTGGGGGGAGDPKPAPPKMPFPLRRAMEQRAQKSALPEGERALPVGGLLFFQYRGKDSSVQSVELLYEGAAGKATITLMR